MENYKFNISLSVLNHLGRNLYRSLITVIGEAISNSWDADAKNVHIYIDRGNNQLVVQDDGTGMTSEDFQKKFLMIGYSKRKDGASHSSANRPFIGRKGIGKLALLSCAQNISILTKTTHTELTGGTIDNAGLDEAIKDNVEPNDYSLIPLNKQIKYDHLPSSNGTTIIFDNLHDGIKNRIDYLRQLIALDFRFTIFDPSFGIFVNDEKISMQDLDFLIRDTQFLWLINSDSEDDEFAKAICNSSSLLKKQLISCSSLNISGFIASVNKPSKLKVGNSKEKATIDLFVNGRLREKNIISHIPSTRIVESYLYGQIHFNELDDEEDRFTSSREGVVPDDPKFRQLLKVLDEEIMTRIINEWDVYRCENRESGDSENNRISRKRRKSQELFNEITDDYTRFEQGTSNEQKNKINSWINALKDDATFNYESYGECFVAENLLRTYIDDQKVEYNTGVKNEAKDCRTKEARNIEKAHLFIPIRYNPSDLSYASMSSLASNIEDTGKIDSINQDAKEFKPIRDALAHTARLTEEAKLKLTTVFNNIKYRLISLLQKSKSSSK